MKFGRLILANLFRKKIRLLLTIGSFAVALFLFGLLFIVDGAFGGVDLAGADRLVVINRVSIIQPLPMAYRDRILQIPGVKAITYDNWFGGVYQDERNFFPQFAIDVENQKNVFTELVVPDEQWAAFVKDRQGAIAGAATAKRFGWKIGDPIPIKGTIVPKTMEYNLVGIYHCTKPNGDETQFWFHWEYLNEQIHAGSSWKDMAGWYTARIENPDDANRIAKTIDEMFENSSYETRSAPEKVFFANWIKQMGNIKFLILSIGTVVFVTLLLVTGNTMAIAVRERTGELAVLKAIGFSDRSVLWMVLLESLAIAALGGGIGIGLAKLFALRGDPTNGMLPLFFLSGKAMVLGIAAALVVGLAAGILPAVGAMRLRVVNALRRV